METLIVIICKILMLIPLILLSNYIDTYNKLYKNELIVLRLSAITVCLSIVCIILNLKVIAQMLQLLSSIGYVMIFLKMREIVFNIKTKEIFKYAMFIIYLLHTSLIYFLYFILIVFSLILISLGNVVFYPLKFILFNVLSLSAIITLILSYIYIYVLYKSKNTSIFEKESIFEKNNSFECDIFEEEEILDTVDLNNFRSLSNDDGGLYEEIKITLNLAKVSSIDEEIDALFD